MGISSDSGTSWRQWLLIALILAMLMAAGAALEGRPTPENALMFARVKEVLGKLHMPILMSARQKRIASDTEIIERGRNNGTAADSDVLLSAYLDRAANYFSEKRRALAERDLAVAILLHPSAEMRGAALMERAVVRDCARQYDAALSDVNAGLKAQPPGPLSARNFGFETRADIYGHLGKFDLAVADLTASISFSGQQNAAIDEYLSRNIAGRDKFFVQAIQRNRQRYERMLARYYFQRSYWQQRAGHSAAALADDTASIALLPRNPAAYDRRARLYFGQGRLTQAWTDYWHGMTLGGPNIQICPR